MDSRSSLRGEISHLISSRGVNWNFYNISSPFYVAHHVWCSRCDYSPYIKGMHSNSERSATRMKWLHLSWVLMFTGIMTDTPNKWHRSWEILFIGTRFYPPLICLEQPTSTTVTCSVCSCEKNKIIVLAFKTQIKVPDKNIFIPYHYLHLFRTSPK